MRKLRGMWAGVFGMVLASAASTAMATPSLPPWWNNPTGNPDWRTSAANVQERAFCWNYYGEPWWYQEFEPYMYFDGGNQSTPVLPASWATQPVQISILFDLDPASAARAYKPGTTKPTSNLRAYLVWDWPGRTYDHQLSLGGAGCPSHAKQPYRGIWNKTIQPADWAGDVPTSWDDVRIEIGSWMRKGATLYGWATVQSVPVGGTNAPAVVPELSTGILVGIGGLGVILRRKRKAPPKAVDVAWLMDHK